MKMPSPWRVQAKGIQSIAIVWGMYQFAWRDDRKITIEDFPELAAGMGRLSWLWIPEILSITAVSTTPLVVLEAAIAVGAVASIAIAGEEGLDTYVDYITNPQEIVGDEGKRNAFLKAADITLSILNPIHIPVKMLGEYIVEDLPWGELLKNRWLTGPALPF
jgi:hypothetical protein